MLSVVGLIALFLFGALVTAPAIQAEVRDDVNDRLAGAGIETSNVSADGRRVAVQVAASGPGDIFIEGLAASSTCKTWVGELTCPSRVIVERDAASRSGNKLSGSGSANPDQATAVRVESDSAGGSGMRGQIGVETLVASPDAVNQCNDAFADILSEGTIRFQTGSATIATGNEELLRQLASAAASCPGNLTINGHTDSSGDAAANAALSLARASAVRDALAGLGIDAGRLNAVGHGAAMPIADNESAAGRAKNRRIEISVDQAR